MKTVSIKNFLGMKKLDSALSENKRYCKCGHSIIFPKTSKTNKAICTHCGRYIFKSDLLEFEYRLKEKQRKM